MSRAPHSLLALLALTLPLPPALPGSARAQEAAPMYVETFVPSGTPLNVLKRVTCRAPEKADLAARVYMTRVGRRLRVARVDYTPALRSVLVARKLPVLNRYYDQYMTRGEVFEEWTMNALISLSRVLGMRFDLDGRTYQCTLS
ncbi:hypothetical protein [Deinococcus enclensis]|uniref:Uncharacterized protein n=1 Tax=Deinococcus enclensis TaxID=1049582 RepID=A0ABT9MDT5_9DEIO|nr:hypothetical protein [Deinococcus enclensis]MDP9764649.1 hypothetical protein [Deinococcus enclensis]